MPAVPLLPDIHPLVDKTYRAYDIGQVGQLDVHILTGIFGGEKAARDLTPAWDGGIYWAGQLRSATSSDQASTKSVALLYLSVWKSSTSAEAFAKLYEEELGRKYSGVKLDPSAPPPDSSVSDERVYSTSEGPVVITTRGKTVFVSESFDLALARHLSRLILNAQGSGEMKMAGIGQAPLLQRASLERVRREAGSAPPRPLEPLSGSLVHFLTDCGVMKFAVDAAIEAVK